MGRVNEGMRVVAFEESRLREEEKSEKVIGRK